MNYETIRPFRVTKTKYLSRQGQTTLSPTAASDYPTSTEVYAKRSIYERARLGGKCRRERQCTYARMTVAVAVLAHFTYYSSRSSSERPTASRNLVDVQLSSGSERSSEYGHSRAYVNGMGRKQEGNDFDRHLSQPQNDNLDLSKIHSKCKFWKIRLSCSFCP